MKQKVKNYLVILNMTGVEGFEPPNGGTKNRCLTTWRHPKYQIYLVSNTNKALFNLIENI